MSSSSEEGEKYSLRPRSIAKRLEVEQKLKLTQIKAKTKSHSAKWAEATTPCDRFSLLHYPCC